MSVQDVLEAARIQVDSSSGHVPLQTASRAEARFDPWQALSNDGGVLLSAKTRHALLEHVGRFRLGFHV